MFMNVIMKDEDRSCRRQKDPFDEPDNRWDESDQNVLLGETIQ